jgi:hypothetical protein
MLLFDIAAHASFIRFVVLVAKTPSLASVYRLGIHMM